MNTSCKFLDGGYTVNTHGNVKPCCMLINTNEDNLPYWEVEDHQQSDFWKLLKNNLDSGIKDKRCYRCWNAEDVNENSLRKYANKFFSQEWVGPPTPWSYLDLKLGNLCNLQCRMCNSSSSSQIVKEIQNNIDENWPEKIRKNYEYTIKRDTNWYNNPKFYDQIKENAAKVRLLKFTGGEPTLISHVHELIQWFVDSGHAEHTEVRITTNGTNTKPKLFENMQKFKAAELRVSCDGVGKVYEYIRYPFKWKQFEKNMKVLKTQFDIPVIYAFTLIPYNLFDVINFSKWFEINKKEGQHWQLTPAVNPKFMDVRNLSEDIIQKAIKYLRKSDDKNIKYVVKFLFSKSQLSSYNDSNKELINYTKILDRLRNQDIKNIMEDLV